MANSGFCGAAEPLTKEAFRSVVRSLGVGMPELLAVLAVESKSCGFLPDRRPIILFERHIFHKRTGGRYSELHTDISNKQPGGYAGLGKEYPRLQKAARLDRTAALMSTSWGAGQIMGFNHALAGFPDVESMVAAMQDSEAEQLAAVANFLKAAKLAGYLATRNWTAFARAYNGSGYSKNKYDTRLAGAYQQYAAGLLPDVEARRAQLYLTYLGYAPGAVDGVHGKFSRSAVLRFREQSGMGNSDRVDGELLAALQARVKALSV